MKQHYLRQRAVTFLLLVALVPSLTGCFLVFAGTAAGVAAAAYIHGKLEATEQVNLDRAWSAAERALAELQFPIVEQKRDGLAGRMVARTANEEEVRISFESASPSVTNVTIRYGTFGNEPLSRRVLETIRKYY